MKPSEVTEILLNSYEAKTPLLITGPPGVGKSDIVRSVAKFLDISLIDQRLSQMDPVDIRGIPVANHTMHKTDWYTPDFLPQVERDGEKGILFLDELTSAPKSVQPAAYQLILDRCLGEYVLPDGWLVVAAGNRAEDRAITTTMSTALSNRFGHLSFEHDLDEWIDWALNNDIDSSITSFIRYRPELLHDMNFNQHANPTPRSWTFVNKHIPFLTPSNRFNTVAAFVGPGAAGEFLAFFEEKEDLISFDMILMDPENSSIPDKPSTLYALTGVLTANITIENMPIVMKYINRLEIEYQIITIQDSTKKNKALTKTESFTNWALENNEIIL